MTRSISACFVLTFALVLTGCGQSGTAEREGSNAGPAAWLIDSEPAGALAVAEAKSQVQAGDEVVVRGRIGGRVNPMSDDSPVFTIMDLSVPHCGQMGEEDHCPTPWDYCCETAESKRANAATVQVVDAQGSPVGDKLAASGLNNLDEVVLVGTVGPRPNQDVLMIRATGVYRVPGATQ